MSDVEKKSGAVAAARRVDKDEAETAQAAAAVEAVANDIAEALIDHTAVSATPDRARAMRTDTVKAAERNIEAREKIIHDNNARIAAIDGEIRNLADERRGLFRQNVAHQEGIHAAKMFLIGHGE